MRRGHILQVVLLGIVIGGIAGLAAYFIPWLPTPASKQAGRIWALYWFETITCIVIFAVVMSVLVFAVLKFRAKPDDLEDGPPIHGSTKLEIWWTAIPTAIVIAIATASSVVLIQNGHAGPAPLHVRVIAEQFSWTFQYPEDGDISTGELRLPLGRTVQLDLYSRDVLHSFWVPNFAQKQDTVPGDPKTLIVTTTRLGTYPVICTELCGLGHATMRSQVVVMPPADYDKWVADTKAALAGGGGAAGATVFANNGCGACHTLAKAKATGKVGPSLELDNLKKGAQGAGQPLDAYVRESIVKPNAYIVPGFPPNVMPGNFGTLPPSQIAALVQYLTAP